jgi:hypothetical protein
MRRPYVVAEGLRKEVRDGITGKNEEGNQVGRKLIERNL